MGLLQMLKAKKKRAARSKIWDAPPPADGYTFEQLAEILLMVDMAQASPEREELRRTLSRTIIAAFERAKADAMQATKQ